MVQNSKAICYQSESEQYTETFNLCKKTRQSNEWEVDAETPRWRGIPESWGKVQDTIVSEL